LLADMQLPIDFVQECELVKYFVHICKGCEDMGELGHQVLTSTQYMCSRMFTHSTYKYVTQMQMRSETVSTHFYRDISNKRGRETDTKAEPERQQGVERETGMTNAPSKPSVCPE
jgi:hypothetical protein